MTTKSKEKDMKEKIKKPAAPAAGVKAKPKKDSAEKPAAVKKPAARKTAAKKEKPAVREERAAPPKAEVSGAAAPKKKSEAKPAPKPAPAIEQKAEARPAPKAQPLPKIEPRPAPKAEAPKSAPKIELKPAPKAEAPKSAAAPKPVAKPPEAEEKPKEAPAPAPSTPTPSPTPPPAQETKPAAAEATQRILEFDIPVGLKDLASKLGIKPNEIILELMSKNIFATINQNLGEDMVINILKGRGIEYRKPPKIEEQVAKEHLELEAKQDVRHLVARPPVVTFMGHVDHGKTSLLDFIRKTRVADKEKGGITQHIGAYEVKLKNGSVTFLDTPGHEAFTAMRARGANATDIVVLVVAADDGVMPQTKEALDHARAAEVTIVVALNKCDLPSANIDKVKAHLSQIGLMSEDWGGKTIVVPVSAKTGEGVDALLEMLHLEAELLELQANPHLRARGVVIEGKLSSGQGPVATVLVKNGTLKLGDMILTGMHYGRIKAMMDHTGSRVQEAPPSKPVTILGLSGVPMAGDEFFVVRDEKKARTLSVLKQDEARSRRLKSSQRVTLEDFYSKMKEGVAKELAILLKGDVQGSVEALKASLLELNTKDVKVNVIHADVGNISESDVMLAVASNAVVMGFSVKTDEGAAALAAKEGIEIKPYNIIYEAIEDVRAAMEGLLEPISKEVFVGRATIKQVFRVTKAGTIAGSQVVKGKIVRTGIAKLVRDRAVIYEGKIASLKRFKDDVREVAEGFECGIGLAGHDDIKVGDLIEVYQIEKVARRLESRR